jgi:hypothetical protein
MMRASIVTLIYISFGGEASAQNFQEIIALQSRLKQEKLYSGELDGAFGPMMRSAVEEFAETHNLEPSFDAISNYIMIQSHLREKREPSEEELDLARSHVEAQLRDAESARYRNEYAFDVEDSVIVCGEVNGRNGYGAYAGFQTYQTTILRMQVGDFDEPYTVGDPLIEHALLMCAHGTSLMAALKAEGG